ncbi:SDR family oxidoreductase [Chitinophaga polysaccharea]|uniref:SDR family oxidoreductase n=1 Tax=Chitinophaga polysaccharea TaxID=1293035 RepID=UPI0011591A3B|nr:SDR family oxidoreductase [Chitinophaga polysaccharea]
MTNTNVLLTGVTGILGRHVLYELLYLYASGRKMGALGVVIRTKSGQTGLERLKTIIAHRYRPAYLKGYAVNDLLKHITLIEAGIEELNAAHLVTLENFDNLHVIHTAAETDLSNTSTANEKAFTHNYLATKHLLAWCTPKLYKFIFISSAFSIGHHEGVITDQYIQFDAGGDPVLNEEIKNRNPYERFKIKMEFELIKYCRQHGKAWQIVRPSSICGRMLDEPLYYTPTFNVFYLFGKFLYACSLSNILRMGEKIRIAANPAGSMNIVPVDYVAKAIVRSFENDAIGQLNAVSSRHVPVAYLFQSMCNYAGIKCDLTACEPPPGSMSVLEKQYYETIGPMFSSYLSTPVHQFDTVTLRGIMSDVAEADVVKGFKDLYEFAYENEFRSL